MTAYRGFPSWFGATGVLLLALSACGSDTSAESGAADIDDPELQELVTAAQDEGTLTLYGVPDEPLLQSLGEEFTELYGVNVESIRLVSADLAQRFSSEAGAGAPASDVILLTHSPFYGEAMEEDWLAPLSDADVPGQPDDYPEDFLVDDGETALVSLVPTSMVYNTDTLDVEPTSWEDYADPQFQGQLAIAEPASSPANLAFWQLMRDEYGDDFLRGIADNDPTWHNSAVSGTQAVGAGEEVLGHPGVQAIVDNLQDTGAPIEAVVPGPSTGPEIALGIAAEAENPNAAALFAHYVLSEEGSTFFAEISNAASPYGHGLDDFHRPQEVSEEQGQEIEELLGAE